MNYWPSTLDDMMPLLKRVKSVKDFGIFSDYSHPTALPDFARYNVIYGWNGAGKTTLTRLLRCLEKEEIFPDFAACTFSIERSTEGTSALTHDALNGISNRIRVFNRDFIEENLDLDIKRGGKAKPVAHVGKANIDKGNQLKKLKAEIKLAIEKRDLASEKIESTSGTLDKLASSIGSEIKAATQTARKDGYKNYNKANVKAAYSSKTIKDHALTTDQFDKLKASINSENKADITLTLSPCPDLITLQNEVRDILSTEVLSEQTIERLKKNPVIESWVKSGLTIHDHDADKPCEFCGNKFTRERLAELARHFSSERQIFLELVESKISNLQEQKLALATSILPNPAEFFPEFSDGYKDSFSALHGAIIIIGNYIDTLLTALEGKKTHLQGAVELDGPTIEGLNSLTTGYLKSQEAIINISSQHNKKAHDFDASIQKDKESIEYHFLSVRHVKYRTLESQIASLQIGFTADSERLKKLTDEKDAIEKEIQDTRIACAKINEHLRDYLGHDEINFEDFEDGYAIKRNGKIAKNLSEGEKTAIAFVYFANTLKDNFELTNGIVIIDDPVSSLDSNNMHHAFHFMVAHIKDAAQLFVLTHNFSFLRKLKQWFKAAKTYNKIEVEYFQLLSLKGSDGNRTSRISVLDPLLKTYDSEYHYLFKLLVDSDNRSALNEDVSYEELYPMVNAGRKVLETFLDFKYPSNPDKFSQLTNAKVQQTGEAFDTSKAELLYGLLNDGSHAGFDTGGFDTFRNSPEIIKRAIESLLDFIGAIDPVHYANISKCKGVKNRTRSNSSTGNTPPIVTPSQAPELMPST